MAPSLQLAYRTQKTIGVLDADPVYEPLAGFSKPEGNLRCSTYSPCGQFFGWASSESVGVVETATGKQILSLPIVNVHELSFSPKGTFLMTWERPGKDEAGDATKNLKVWRVVDKMVDSAEKHFVGQFVQKQQVGWNLQYTADEQFCARLVTNEVQFYESKNLATVWSRLRMEGVTDFAVAPGMNYAVAVFVPERKGASAGVRIYKVPSFEFPVSSKNFFKGDKVQMKWNARGSRLLVLAQTDVDKSGKSYYGETALYMMSLSGTFDTRVMLDKEGPIHDVSWSPTTQQFGVVYGYMPAKATLFNDRAVVVHSFSLGPRNTITFSPGGRFVLLAGFGNLAGQIDVYDLNKDHRKICTIESGNPSVCEWSPDSRYIMTATTSPRLRVDNGVKLWHVGGRLMYNEDMVELYNVSWRPMDWRERGTEEDALALVPAPHSSVAAYLGTVKTPSKPAGAYRPPGARGLATPMHFKREDEGGAAHVVGNGMPNVGTNGFGRARRAVPGAELAEGGGGGSVAVRVVPGAEPAGEDGAKKNKKKRSKRNNNVHNGSHQGEDKLEAEPNGGASLAPPKEYGAGSGSESRSPERRGNNGNGNGNYPRAFRSRSRTNAGDRSHSNTQQGARGQAGGQAGGQASGQGVQGNASAEAAGSQNPNAKKIRSLQKKVRAIEDLEMRLAGGEKLEDTQLKKIYSKTVVMKELESLGGEM